MEKRLVRWYSALSAVAIMLIVTIDRVIPL